MPVSDYEDIIQAAAHEWNVDPILIKAVMHQESGGNRTRNGKPITSSAGAGGLMQIMPRTAKDLGVVDVHDPEQAIWGGTKYLSQMLDRFQDPKLAVAAYNAGPGNIEAGRFPAETRAYVPAVASHYQMFSKSGGVAARAGGTDVAGPGAKPVDTLPSDDDFLKQTGAGKQADTSLPADDEFLKTTGAKVSGPAPTPQAASPTPDFIPGVIRHEYDNPIGTLPTIPSISPIDAGAAGRATRDAIGNALSSVGREARNILSETGADASTLGRDIARGAAEGFGQGPLGLSDQSANALRSMGPFPDLAEGVVRPVTAAADLFLRGASGAMRGAQEGIMSLGRMTGQEAAARTIAAAPEAFAGMVSGGARGNPLRGEPIAITKNPLARRTVDGPGAPIPLEAGAPSSVGAMGVAPRVAEMAPREAAASRATGEMQRALAPAREGVDTTIYVPGTKPTEAEVSGSPSVAFDQKLNRSQNPDPHISAERANNEARVEYFEQTAGTPTQAQRMKDTRSEQADMNITAAFKNEQKADAQPVVDTIHDILGDPRLGERDLVHQYVSPILDKLVTKDGALKDNPKSLYGIREDVTDKLSKSFAAKDPAINQVRPQLIKIQEALDQAIEKGAPGYKKYLSDYADASRPIDAMEYLQDARKTLTNANGVIQPGAYHRFMINTISDRAARGINAAKSLTEEQMDVLHNLHSDLKRAQNINLSNPRGSDTNMLTEGTKRLAEVAAHGVANVISPVMGSIGLQMGKNALKNRSMKKMTERVLNPNPLKYPPAEP